MKKSAYWWQMAFIALVGEACARDWLCITLFTLLIGVCAWRAVNERPLP